MDNTYIKEGKDLKEKSQSEKEIELIISIIKAKNDLEIANKNYEYAEGNLIDYYLYEIKANQSRLDYLIKTAKEVGVQADFIKAYAIKKKRVV
jgi:hypothetical protein